MDFPKAADLSAEMRLMAQTTIIAVFARLMRIRIATQHGRQRDMTLDLLKSEFEEALLGHESQVLVDDKLSERGHLFKSTFLELTTDLMIEVGRGLTDDEKSKLGLT